MTSRIVCGIEHSFIVGSVEQVCYMRCIIVVSAVQVCNSEHNYSGTRCTVDTSFVTQVS